MFVWSPNAKQLLGGLGKRMGIRRLILFQLELISLAENVSHSVVWVDQTIGVLLSFPWWLGATVAEVIAFGVHVRRDVIDHFFRLVDLHMVLRLLHAVLGHVGAFADHFIDATSPTLVEAGLLSVKEGYFEIGPASTAVWAQKVDDPFL